MGYKHAARVQLFIPVLGEDLRLLAAEQKSTFRRGGEKVWMRYFH
jgi:hypothetical protein